jgi:NADP-dependent 3-hydroxy acid dehydrogenase YdfG
MCHCAAVTRRATNTITVAGLQMRAFEGQVAVITGGGSGVGQALALALADGGAKLHLVGRRLDRLEAVASKAREFDSKVTCYSADISTEVAQFELLRQLKHDLGRVDILIQNAGMYVRGSLENADIADLDRHFRTNVRAPYALTQALLPLLKVNRGQVVFINSSSGIVAKAMSAQYDSTKHALKAIADSLRAEINPDGVRVLSIYLGRTASEMQQRICAEEGRPYCPELLLQPTDVAAIVLNALGLPRTAEVTDIWIRPMIKSS